MNKPLVTVIVPVYNSEAYLKKCIDNLISQSYENLQIIFVNDGSTDNSYELLCKVDDSRVEVYTKENGGASTARNYGLNHRKGEYVLFVDSDDYLREDAVEILVEKAIQTQADCIYFEGENNTSDPTIKFKKDGLSQKIDYPQSTGRELIRASLVNKNYHAAPVLYFIRGDVFDSGLKFEEGIVFEDELFTFTMLWSCKKVVSLREKLYIRNVRPGSVMTSEGKEKHRFHSISVVFERLFEKFEDNKNDDVYKMYISRIAMLWLGYVEQLPKQVKEQVSQRYKRIRKQILDNKGFDNKEVVVRCYGKYLWYAYITPSRLINKLWRK